MSKNKMPMIESFIVTCEVCDSPLEVLAADSRGWTAACSDRECATLHRGTNMGWPEQHTCGHHSRMRLNIQG